MKRFARFGSIICMTALLMSLFGGVKAVRADEEALIRQDTWSLETLLRMGAELPTYHADGNYYEIAAPEQLFYLSGVWKPEDTNNDGAPDAPCNGKYVLTAEIGALDFKSCEWSDHVLLQVISSCIRSKNSHTNHILNQRMILCNLFNVSIYYI